jgi:hypothetical protein
MGFSRGSLTLSRMNAHRLVIVAAALTVAVAAALATALVTFSGQALPRAVRTDLGHATGTSFVIRGSVDASQGAQYTSMLPGKVSAALEGTPFAFYRAYWSDPLERSGRVPRRRPRGPAGGPGPTEPRVSWRQNAMELGFHVIARGRGPGLQVTEVPVVAVRSAYRAVRRLVTGPGAPAPMVRPSTDRTGTRPPMVPVTNASSAV